VSGEDVPRLAVSDLRVVLKGTGADIVDEIGLVIDAGEVVGLVG
jgi:ABC-type glutathione transport system ATPase component